MSNYPKVVNYCIELVRTPSLSGSEGDVAKLIKEFLSAEGIDEVFIDDVGNVIGVLRGRDDFTVVFEGHMDHVPPGNLNLWKYPPYEAKIIEGVVVGRGTVDMKGAIASMIASVSHVSKLKDLPTTYYIFVPHEEIAEGVAFKYAIEESLKTRPNLVILGEATNLNLSIGQRGRAVIEVELLGRSSHASMPSEGVNALVATAWLVSKVVELSENLPKHELLGRSTIAPTVIECSPKTPPMIPDKCRLIIDRRFIVGEDEGSIVSEIRRLTDQLVKKGLAIEAHVGIIDEELTTWTGRKLLAHHYFPAWLTELKGYVLKVREALLEVVKRAKVIAWRFSTDGVYSAGMANIPTVGIGPGDESLAHKPNENVPIKHLEKCVKIYFNIMKSLGRSISKN